MFLILLHRIGSLFHYIPLCPLYHFVRLENNWTDDEKQVADDYSYHQQSRNLLFDPQYQVNRVNFFWNWTRALTFQGSWFYLLQWKPFEKWWIMQWPLGRYFILKALSFLMICLNLDFCPNFFGYAGKRLVKKAKLDLSNPCTSNYGASNLSALWIYQIATYHLVYLATQR